MIAYILIFILAIPVTAFIVGVVLSGPRYHGPVTSHFDGKKFLNPTGVQAKGTGQVFKWMLQRERGPWHEDLSENYGMHPLAHCKDGVRITFVNHATFLIQVDGLNILTDPVWSKRVSPFSWIGPKRMKLPGIKFEHLPRIHVVLLTHNHYDHLDLQSMRMVFGAHHPKIIAPLGVKKFLDKHYLSGAIELDWWQQQTLTAPVTIQAVPAQHFSGRGLLDRDATLWCGYVIRSSQGNIYFAGDTGYNEYTFKEIGGKCGPLKISVIPIGAYKPNWFMSPIHVSPEEALRIHKDVKSETSIAMHFGTFPLADDGHDEPEADLRAAMDKYQVAASDFVVLKEGEVKIW